MALALVLVLSFSLVTAVPAAAVGGKICMVDPDYTGDQGAESNGMYWYSTLADIGAWGPGDDAIVYLAAGEHMGKTMPVGKVYDCLYLSGATNVQIIGAGADETIVWGQLSRIGTGTEVKGITFKGNLNEQEPPQEYRIDMGAAFTIGTGAVTFDHVIFDGFEYQYIAGMPAGSTVDHCDFIAESFWVNYKTYRAITWSYGAHGTVTNSIFASPWYVLSSMNFGSPSEIRNNDFYGGKYGIPGNNGTNITGNLYIDPELNEDYSLPDGSPLLTAGIDGTYIGAIAPIETFTITATAGEGGAISPSGDVVVNSGGSQAFTITPSEGYEIADVVVDGESVLDELVDNTYTFVNVTADHIISATFVHIVEIDIKPGSDPNSINLGDHGVLPVTILGSPSFDVDTIDLSSITLGGESVTTRGPAKAPKLAVSYEDVNGDDLMDLVAFFSVQELVTSGALGETTTELMLEAETTDDVSICGIDSVRVVPPE